MKKLLIGLFILSLVVIGLPPLSSVKAATLSTASLTLTDSRINQATNTYSFKMSNVTLSAVMCFTVKFTPNADGSGTALPTGMNITSAAVVTGSTDYIPAHTGFGGTVSNNVFTYKHATTGQTPANASNRNFVINTITNGSTPETAYYAVFKTFTNTDCATGPIDTVTVSFIFTNGQTVTATVDPTLTFTIAAVSSGGTVNGATTNITSTTTTVPFGTITTSANKIAAQDLAVATNAGGGYTVTIRYTGTFTNGSGGNITDFGSGNASPNTFSGAGTSAFGYTTEDTVLGTGTAGRFSGNKWAAFTTSPLEVAYNAAAVSETTRVGYQAGIAATTPAGAYQTTVIFTATPIY